MLALARVKQASFFPTGATERIALRSASTPSRRAMNQADPRLGGQVLANRNAVQPFIERTLAAGLAIEIRQPVFLARLGMWNAISESIR